VKSSCETAPDEALLRRVQQQNQRQVIGKLLHDLRNPIHSMRITMELFSRLARRNGDQDKLIERAATYIGPAEAALGNLLSMNEQLGIYLANPVPPSPSPLGIQEWLTEIASLLRASIRQLQVELPSSESLQGCRAHADRARASHALLQYCLSAGPSRVSLAVRADAAEHIYIDVSFGAADASRVEPQEGGPNSAEPRLTYEELSVLIENAGGSVAAGAGQDVSLRFKLSETIDPAGR
jgi:signal transduction histidine kinase